MGFDTITFMITLINEFENAAINRRTCDFVVGRAKNHNHYARSCFADLWICGRCFCDSPLMRSFDQLGKLCITPLTDRQGIYL